MPTIRIRAHNTADNDNKTRDQKRDSKKNK